MAHLNVTAFSKVVTTSGTGVALASASTVVRGLVIQAKKVGGTNTGDVYVGDSTVDKTSIQILTLSNSSVPLTILAPGRDSIDLADVYIDAATSADGVVGLYWQ